MCHLGALTAACVGVPAEHPWRPTLCLCNPQACSCPAVIGTRCGFPSRWLLGGGGVLLGFNDLLLSQKGKAWLLLGKWRPRSSPGKYQQGVCRHMTFKGSTNEQEPSEKGGHLEGQVGRSDLPGPEAESREKAESKGLWNLRVGCVWKEE